MAGDEIPRPGNGLGMATALAEALRARPEGPPGTEPIEQYDLDDFLGLPPSRSDGQALTSHIGRPPGARNKATKDWTRYFLTRFGSPLEVLGQIMRADVDALVKQVGCTALEALQEKRIAAATVLPFVHSRQPIALDVRERKLVHLTIDNTPANGASGGGDTFTIALAQAGSARMSAEVPTPPAVESSDRK